MFSRVFPSLFSATPSQLIDKILNTRTYRSDIYLSRSSARVDERLAQYEARLAGMPDIESNRLSVEIGERLALWLLLQRKNRTGERSAELPSAPEGSSFENDQRFVKAGMPEIESNRLSVGIGELLAPWLRKNRTGERSAELPLASEASSFENDERFVKKRFHAVLKSNFCSTLLALVYASVILVISAKFWTVEFGVFVVVGWVALLLPGLVLLVVLSLRTKTDLCKNILSIILHYHWAEVGLLLVCLLCSISVASMLLLIHAKCWIVEFGISVVLALASVGPALALVALGLVTKADLYKNMLPIIIDYHWAEVGLVVVDAALEIADINSDCLGLLESMNDLSKVILKLHLSSGLKMELHAKLNDSILLIVEGAMLCYSQGGGETSGRQSLRLKAMDIRDMCKIIEDALAAAQNKSIVNRDAVREQLRALHPEAYDPTRVGLGIYHHEMNPYSSKMVEEKVKALCRTVKRLKIITVENFVAQIQKMDAEIRNWYTHTRGSLSEEILPWNFAMDACFILEFFRSSYWFLDKTIERELKVDIFKLESQIEREIMMDIFKLENQIPLFILRKIFELEFQTSEKAISKLARMLCMQPEFAILPFCLKPLELEILQAEIEVNIKENSYHMLHLLSKSIEAFLTPSNIPIDKTNIDIGNDFMDFMSSVVYRDANIVKKFLIRFKPSKDGKVRFKNRWFGSGVLYLPQIFLFEETEPLLWNLIAFAVGSKTNIIGHFIFFMNCVIRSSKGNIALLKQGQIIMSNKDEDELEAMFRNIANALCESCGPFEEVQSQINEHYNKPFNKQMLWFTSLLLQIVFSVIPLVLLVVLYRFFIR